MLSELYFRTRCCCCNIYTMKLFIRSFLAGGSTKPPAHGGAELHGTQHYSLSQVAAGRVCTSDPSAARELRPSVEKTPSLKRSARRLFAAEAKRCKKGPTLDLSDAPSSLTEDWPRRYSNLQHMAESPMARTVLKALKNKATNINFMCSEVCGAAVREGSRFYQTRALSGITKESKFHSHLAKDLPKVERIQLPIQVRKKVAHRKFSCLPYSCS